MPWPQRNETLHQSPTGISVGVWPAGFLCKYGFHMQFYWRCEGPIGSGVTSSLSALFRCTTRFTDLVQCVMKYAKTIAWNKAGSTSKVESPTFCARRSLPSSSKNPSLLTCCKYTHVEKLLMENQNFVTLVGEQRAKGKVFAKAMNCIVYLSTMKDSSQTINGAIARGKRYGLHIKTSVFSLHFRRRVNIILGRRLSPCTGILTRLQKGSRRRVTQGLTIAMLSATSV